MAWGALLPIPLLSEAAAVCAFFCSVGALLAVPGMIRSRSESRYDLNALRNLHEKEELRQIEIEAPAEFDSVHCLQCGQVYNFRLAACPRCGSQQGQR